MYPIDLHRTEPLPLALLSHGNETFAGFYCFLAGELASRGYVVAMLEHTDGSCTGLRSAKGVERVFGERRPEAVGKPSHVVRTEDVTAALDYLEAHRGSMLGGGGDDSAAPRPIGRPLALVFRGFLVNASNPKAIVFILAVLPSRWHLALLDCVADAIAAMAIAG